MSIPILISDWSGLHLNRLTPACSATDSDLLDLIYVPINLAVDFKEIAEDSVKTFINST